jgi:MFS family permease
VLNAVLGPALPYLRAAEGIDYVVGALHQVAFAVGGGLAGLYATRSPGPQRATTVRVGLAVAGAACLAIGYGGTVVVTVAAALVLSAAGTAALIALWATLSDRYRAQRAVAMSEGEVCVSLGGILAPLLVGVTAAGPWDWRFAFAIAAVVMWTAVLGSLAVRIPAASRGPRPAGPTAGPRRGWPTLTVVFAIVALEFGLSFWLASYLDEDVGMSADAAAALVSVLYAANLAGRLLVSRLARRWPAERLLLGALAVALAGLPILLLAGNAVVASVGIVVAGAGISGTFPLTSALHVAASPGGADRALGQVLLTASGGQIVGPLAVAVVAQLAGLRVGLVTLPALAVAAVLVMVGYVRFPSA